MVIELLYKTQLIEKLPNKWKDDWKISNFQPTEAGRRLSVHPEPVLVGENWDEDSKSQNYIMRGGRVQIHIPHKMWEPNQKKIINVYLILKC